MPYILRPQRTLDQRAVLALEPPAEAEARHHQLQLGREPMARDAERIAAARVKATMMATRAVRATAAPDPQRRIMENRRRRVELALEELLRDQVTPHQAPVARAGVGQ